MRYTILIIISLGFLTTCKMSNNDTEKKIDKKITKKDNSIEIARMILDDFLKDSLNQSKSIVTQENNIKDTESLIRAVEPILFSKYGKEEIMNERPYKINYIKNYWIMTGTLAGDNNEETMELGGTFELIVNPKNGDIVYLMHGK